MQHIEIEDRTVVHTVQQYVELNWLIKKLKGKLPVSELFCLNPNNNAWDLMRYDDKGNMIFRCNSNNNWVKNIYDENGNHIAYLDSGGEVIYYSSKQ